MVTESRISGEMQKCIDNCEESAGVCIETVQYCLQMGGEHANPEHIQMLMVCAEICRTSAYFMHSGSPFHLRTCQVCSEVCEACAESCDQFGGDEQMRRCAEICKECADSCREMAAGEDGSGEVYLT